jgi:hypothetical protein
MSSPSSARLTPSWERRTVSFHPKMVHDATFHKSKRQLRTRAGVCLRRRTARASTRSSDIRRIARSAVLPALYLAQYQQGYITANAIAARGGVSGDHASDGRRRSFYTMFYTKPVGKFVLQVCRTLSCALNLRRAPDRGTAEARDQGGRDRFERHIHVDRSGVSRRVRSRAGRDGERRGTSASRRRVRRSLSTICERVERRRSAGAFAW